MEGEDERDGLRSSGELGPKYPSSQEGMEVDDPSSQSSDTHKLQSGAIASRESPSLLGGQFADICQNVNSFRPIGHFDEQSSKLSNSNVQRGVGLSNIGLSDNSVSEVNKQCTINLNTNSGQDRTFLSDSEGFASNFNTSVSQRLLSSGSQFDQQGAPFHCASPSASGGEGMSGDWGAQRPKGDADPDSTNKISNKRRLLGGVSIGAPAPKIKRKRQSIPEPKQLPRQVSAPPSLLPPCPSPLPASYESKPAVVDDQNASKPTEPILAAEREEISKVPSDSSSQSICENQMHAQESKEGEISHVPENHFKDIYDSLNTEVNVHCNNTIENLMDPKSVAFASGEGVSESEEKTDAQSSLTDVPMHPEGGEGERPQSDSILEKIIDDLKEIEKPALTEDVNDAGKASPHPNLKEESIKPEDSAENPVVQDESDLLLPSLHPQNDNLESPEPPLPALNNGDTPNASSPSLKSNFETHIDDTHEIENQDQAPSDHDILDQKPSPELELSEKVLEESNPAPDVTEDMAVPAQPTQELEERQKDQNEEKGEVEGNHRLTSPQPDSFTDPLFTLEQSVEAESNCSSKFTDPIQPAETDMDPLEKEEVSRGPPTEEAVGSTQPDKNNKERETHPKSREKPSKEGKHSSGEEGTNSDDEWKRRHIRKRTGASGLSAKPKVKNLRRNIREIISDDKLEENTLVAQKEEQLRLQRMHEKQAALREYIEQQQVERLVAEVAEAAEAVTAAEAVEEVEAAEMAAAAAAAAAEKEGDDSETEAKARSDDSDIVVLSSEEEEEEEPKIKEEESEGESSEEEPLLKPKIEIKSENEESMEDSDQKSKSSDESESESDSDVVVLSHSEDEEDTEDVNNSGAHINDEFNVPDAQGRVLVNVGHPENEEDIFLAPQLSLAVKPHQIGGIRFLYDNIVESVEQFKTSNGFGCILAHSMGLGKTLQVVSFTDIFLRHTEAKTVLIIVPINTLQNWQAEYNQWLPEERPLGVPEEVEIRFRKFRVFILNDAQKNLQARFKVINQWHQEGGVLLMGYELYRQLSLKKPKKPKKKKKKKDQVDSEVVDIEEEDKNKELLDEMQKALVRPGPDLVICDEGHRIKNAHANISQALKNIRTKRRVVLTGYPLQNNLLEYWCMVDFIRPNYLGTKTEFCNMFERPIQNGQCVDSTPQDVKIMRYRAHVLHSLLEGFVQRRGHSVLAKTLPTKHENVLLCRMTKIQRTLYSAYMSELKIIKAVANPLKAFAVCCKIWNHPDVLYNFVMKRMNEDFDLDLDEVVGSKVGGKSKKAGKMDAAKAGEAVPPFQHSPMASWNSSNAPPMSRPGMGMPPHPPPMNMGPSMPGMGMQNNMGQQGNMPPSMMLPGMGHPGMGAHSQDGNQQHHGMGLGREGTPHPSMGMGNYGMGMYGMQQNYNMHQMPPPYPWGYNQMYPGNPNDPNVQHYPPNAPYGNPYPPPQYQQPHHMQQQQQQQQQHQQQQQQPLQQQLPMAHHQQPMPSSQGIHGYPPMSPLMHNSIGMGPPPAHPSMHQAGLHLNPSQPNSQQMHDPSMQGLHQQSALNLSHQPNSSNLHPQSTPADMQPHQNNHSMMDPNSPGLHDQNSQSLHGGSQGMGDPQPNSQSMPQDQTSQSLPHNLSNQARSDMVGSQDFPGAGLSQSSADSFPKLSPENLSQSMNENSFSSSQEGLSNLLDQNMKDLGIEDKPAPRDSEMMDSKESLSSLLSVNGNETQMSPATDAKCGVDPTSSSSEDKTKVKVEEDSKEEDKELKQEDAKGDKMEEDEKKEEKKEEVKKDELSFEWAENLFKDYVPGLIENSTKFQVFFKILEGTLKVGDRLLVFSQSLFTLSMLEEFLQKSYIPGTCEGWTKNRSYFRLDGSTSAQEREKLINEFNTNPQVHLFLVSTRAGSLGINLVGANRVIVFDASFNPCHDTQAVCRVYRYGQQKPCHIYRLVTDNSLERRIYDRQVNKQGIADRIVDEMNPEAHLSSKEISNLLVDNEEDPEPEDMADKEDSFEDEILKEIVKEKGIMFTRLPFRHESLLIDRKDKKLSNAEKRLAKRSYELEKQANISYSRPSYSSFYPKNSASQTVMMGTKIGGIVYAKPVGTVRPMQAEMGQKIEGGGTMMHRPNILSRSQSNFPVESLAKQGVSVQQITVPKDVSIPTNSGDGKPIHLKSGQSVMVIKTQKGMYLRLSDGKIIAIRTPPEEAFGLPLNQGSVTIVPTMINNPRPRGAGRGGATPTRRGRPPMSAQYALGQVIPKGTSKGQMAVRILRKPVMSSRGGKTYQTIAVPVSSTGQGALLNKSVVITPAKSGGSNKFLKDLKISPKVQITPVPSKSRSSLSSIAGTSGLTKRLNRNNKLLTAQAMAMKSEEDKKHLSKGKVMQGKKEGGGEGPPEEPISNIKSGSGEDSSDKTEDSKSKESVPEEAPETLGKEAGESDSTNPDTPMETEASKESSGQQQQQQQLPQIPLPEEPNRSASLETTTTNNINTSSPMTDQSNVPLTPVSEESLSQKGSPASSMGISGIMNSAPNSVGSPTISEKDDMFKGSNSNGLSSASSENRPLTTPTTSEPLTGIVKPLVHQNLPAMTPLQGLSSLVPPDEGGPGPPSSQPSFSTSGMSLPHVSTFSQSFSSSQPLFQPFLQQTIPTSSCSTSSPSSGGNASLSDARGSTWAKGQPQLVASSSVASNVAHVAPQIQSSAADLTSQSSFLSSAGTSFTSTPPTHSPMHSLQSLAAPHHQGPLPFPSMSDTSSLSQPQHANSISASGAANTTSSSSLSSSTLTPSISQGSDGPLSLSNLLPTQPYPQPPPEDLIPHHSSALDYLNYSLTASSSAFRRPEFPSSLPTDIQSLLNPPPPTPSQLPSSTHPSSTQATPSPTVSTPSTFSPQAPGYSQYASSYRGHAATTGGFRAPTAMPPGYPPYPSQYGPYAGQYPNLSPHPTATPQTPSMGQYGSLQTPPNPYQGYPPPPPAGSGIPPYSSGLGGFGHGPYPPM